MTLLPLFLLLSLSSLSSSHNPLDPLLLPRPLILEYPSLPSEADVEEVQIRCDSWRFAGEANNLSPWLTVPPECGEYVKDYVTGRKYRSDLEMVAREASAYARSVRIVGDGKDAWVFDVDETLLSNLPYYAEHGFGYDCCFMIEILPPFYAKFLESAILLRIGWILYSPFWWCSEVFNGQEFDKWVDKAMAPAIQSSLKLYEELLGLQFKIFLLTGRGEGQRSVTADNLNRVGFRDWEKLILRGLNDHGKTATTYKSEKRSEIVADGYRILGNSGDQWSDLLDSFMSNRSFKLPNPMYFIP